MKKSDRAKSAGRRDRGQAGPRALADAGRRLDVGAARRRPDEGAHDAGRGVDHHRPLDLREIALLVEHLAGRADADERAQRVEKAHQEERQQDGQEAQAEDAGDVELEGDRGQAVSAGEGQRGHGPGRLAQAEGIAEHRGHGDADEDAAPDPEVEEDGDEDEAEDGEEDLGAPEVADLDRDVGRREDGRAAPEERLRGHAGDRARDDPRLVEADEGEEEADADGEAVLEARRDGVRQPRPDAEEGDERRRPGR